MYIDIHGPVIQRVILFNNNLAHVVYNINFKEKQGDMFAFTPAHYK